MTYALIGIGFGCAIFAIALGVAWIAVERGWIE